MSRVVVAEVIQGQARTLKMPGLLRAYESLARQAREEHWTHEEYLHEILSVEVASRAESAVRQRLREARFPELKTLDTFDFNASEGVDAAQIADLARGRWIADAENLIFAGPDRHRQDPPRYRPRVEAADSGATSASGARPIWCAPSRSPRPARAHRLQRRLARVELLLLDEVGFVPFDRTGGELLFNLVADR